MRGTTTAATPVREVMRSDIVAVLPDTTLGELVQVLAREGISGVPVVDADLSVLGVVSATDLVRHAAQARELPVGDFGAPAGPRHGWSSGGDLLAALHLRADPGGEDAEPLLTEEEATVADLMTPVAFGVGPDDSIADAAQLLVRGRIHRVLVVEDGRLVGIVTPFDVLRALFVDA